MSTTDSFVLIKVNPHRARGFELEEVSTYDDFINVCKSLIQDQQIINDIYYKDMNFPSDEVSIGNSNEYKSFLSYHDQHQHKVVTIYIDIVPTTPSTQINNSCHMTDLYNTPFTSNYVDETNQSTIEQSLATNSQYHHQFHNFRTKAETLKRLSRDPDIVYKLLRQNNGVINKSKDSLDIISIYLYNILQNLLKNL